MKINILLNTNPAGFPKGKLADAELLFDEAGPLKGLKLVGFAVWKTDKAGTGGINVTFPSRNYTQQGSGMKKTYTLLRSQGATDAEHEAEKAGTGLRAQIISAYLQIIASVAQVHAPTGGDFGHSTPQSAAADAEANVAQSIAALTNDL